MPVCEISQFKNAYVSLKKRKRRKIIRRTNVDDNKSIHSSTKDSPHQIGSAKSAHLPCRIRKTGTTNECVLSTWVAII